MECIICDSNKLELLESPKYNILITGDRKFFHGKGIKKAICKECGCIQHLQDENYKKQTSKVFEDYETLYSKSFDEKGNNSIPRLQLIYEKISTSINLPQQGNMLDIGCGGGESLMYFENIYPQWNIYGMDIGEQFRKEVKQLRGGSKGFFVSVDEVKNSRIRFDFISINYALCEIQNVMQILNMVNEILKDNGVLFVIDTDYTIQPYVVNTVEQSIFFDRSSLESLLQRTGLELINTDFVHQKKEVWAFAKKGSVKLYSNLYERNKQLYTTNLLYLNNVIAKVEKAIKKYNNIGIFGMANAGIWIAEIINTSGGEILKQKTIFFVEEDEDIIKRKIGVNNFQIYRMEEVMWDSAILLPFPRYVADSIKERYEKKFSYIKFIIL